MKKYPPCSCIICKREFNRYSSVVTHSCYTSNEKSRSYAKEPHAAAMFAIARNNWRSYYTNPVHCKYCNTELDWFRRYNQFCNRSCAANFNNHTPQRYEKIQSRPKRIKQKTPSATDIFNSQIQGPYTRVKLCTCKYTNIQWYSTTQARIHPSYINNYKQYSYACRFNFGISSYPEWFRSASDLITQYGWYSTPGSNRKGITNTNGISRDHMVSVHYGYVNNISPEIIRHPANCALMPHSINNSKNNNSSITIDELLQRIQKFNSLYDYTP
jgi:hypothetical protein